MTVVAEAGPSFVIDTAVVKAACYSSSNNKEKCLDRPRMNKWRDVIKKIPQIHNLFIHFLEHIEKKTNYNISVFLYF